LEDVDGIEVVNECEENDADGKDKHIKEKAKANAK
jgi:hypothetical protein